jgi:hypothetical protein
LRLVGRSSNALRPAGAARPLRYLASDVTGIVHTIVKPIDNEQQILSLAYVIARSKSTLPNG